MRRLFNTKNKLLNQFLKKSHETDKLNQTLMTYLDPELAEQCQITSFQRGCLTISVSSATWATKFRYAQPSLLSKLRSEGKLYNLRSIKCIVTPARSQPLVKAKRPRSNRQLSEKSATLIRQTAKNIKNDTLRKALEKLADCAGK